MTTNAPNPQHVNPRHVPGRSHAQWCKEKALACLNANKPFAFSNAYAQLYADLIRDKSTKHLKLPRNLGSPDELRAWIEENLK